LPIGEFIGRRCLFSGRIVRAQGTFGNRTISPKIWKEEQKQRRRRGRTEEANWDCAGFKK